MTALLQRTSSRSPGRVNSLWEDQEAEEAAPIPTRRPGVSPKLNTDSHSSNSSQGKHRGKRKKKRSRGRQASTTSSQPHHLLVPQHPNLLNGNKERCCLIMKTALIFEHRTQVILEATGCHVSPHASCSVVPRGEHISVLVCEMRKLRFARGDATLPRLRGSTWRAGPGGGAAGGAGSIFASLAEKAAQFERDFTPKSG